MTRSRARLWSIGAASVCVLLLVGLGASRAAPVAGSIVHVTGRVLHADTRRPVAGVAVLALQMRSGRPPAEASARTGPDGRFRFRLDAGDNPPTIFQAVYREVAYTSGPHRLAGRVEFSADIVVHDTTTDARGLFVGDRAILLEQTIPGVIEVREVLTIGNASSRTYVGAEAAPGGGRTTVRLPLPSGAAQIDVRQGLAPAGQDADGALLDTLPVTPGIRQVVLTYRIPAPAASFDVRLAAGLPTLALHVFAAAPLRAGSEQLPKREERRVTARSVQRLSGKNFTAETVITVRVSDATVRRMPVAAVPVIIAMGIAVAAAAAYPWLRRARRPVEDSDPA